MQTASAARSPVLPYDLFHNYIIPDLLSEHLHLLLVGPVAPAWNAFYTLPLVSFQFRQTVGPLYKTMFGLEKDEDPSVIGDILSFAQSLWRQARWSPEVPNPVLDYTCARLMAGNSLVRIYMCIALARSPDERDWGFTPLEQGYMGVDEAYNDLREEARPRMSDQQRLYLPFTCAMTLCDSISPQRLAFKVAEYLADIVPLISTASVMLKYSQDLQSYMTREQKTEGVSRPDSFGQRPSISLRRLILFKETWVQWMHQTQRVIEDADLLFEQMQENGRLVHSFLRNSSISWEALQVTNIMFSAKFREQIGEFIQRTFKCALVLSL